jgi:PDZ domain/Aspartyl protease
LLFAQSDFLTVASSKKVKIPFQLINNLIIIPVQLNGVAMNFLLDTGVEETVLFSVDKEVAAKFKNIEKIKLKGLGSLHPVEALQSTNNEIKIGKLENRDLTVLIVLDENINFSSTLGVEVNGIIGYDFFKNNVIEINYSTKKIVVYNQKKQFKWNPAFSTFTISIENYKPYIISQIAVNDILNDAKFLIDTGNSDPIWIFEGVSKKFETPQKNIDDFLGSGFSGAIFGKRARIRKLKLQNFEFHQPIAAFPDSSSIQNVKLVSGRVGSLGGGILKRFRVVFDYQNKKVYLKKNSNFTASFNYNMSGVELHHVGLRLVKSVVQNNSVRNSIKVDFGTQQYDLKYKFELKPAIEVLTIRKDSPAEKSGLRKGDIILAINKISSYQYSLQEINDLLKSAEGKEITVEVERNGAVLRFNFALQKIL